MKKTQTHVVFLEKHKKRVLLTTTYFFLFCLLFTLSVPAMSQEQKITLDLKNASLKECITAIEKQSRMGFLYNAREVEEVKGITISVQESSLTEVLDKLLKNTGLSYEVENKVILLFKTEEVSQPIAIKGKVTDEDSQPLPGATILIKGTYKGITANLEGNYTIAVPHEKTVLIFSFVGFKSQEIEVGKQTTINVTLEQAATELDEVTINAGYYKTSRREATGNISKITAKKIEQQPVNNPLLALQGRMTGVQIQETSGTPGAPINIYIRGLNSINRGQSVGGEVLPNANRPFFIIDGVPFISESLNSLINGNPLIGLKPDDIESIEILKDADATAIYGSRGANGVVLITTKKGKAGKTQIDIDFSHGVGMVPNKVDLLNTEQYLQMRREALENDDRWPMPSYYERDYPDLLVWDQNRYTDWQDLLIKPTGQTKASLSVSGGSDQTQFVFRTNVFKQTNAFSFDDRAFIRGSGHFNLNHSSKNNKFNVNLSTTFTSSKNTQAASNAFNLAITLPPNAPALYDANGGINWEDNTFQNPLGALEQTYENKSQTLVTSARFSYLLTPNLKANVSLGFTNSKADELSLTPLSSRMPLFRSSGGSSAFGNGSSHTWIIEPQLSYTRQIGKGSLKVLIGTSFQESISERKAIGGSGYTLDVLLSNIDAAPSIRSYGFSYSQYRYNAIYGRLNYNWDNKYIINITGRRDGSSRFGPGKKFGNFGAVGMAWNFSEENFVQQALPFISFGKLRSSYGLTGNDQIGNYQYLSSYSVTTNEYNNVTGLTATRLANPDYSWETNKKFEVGLELGLFNNKLNMLTVWFQNRSSNQLIGRPLPEITGFTKVQFNLPALVENRGWEFELSTTIINTSNFQWNTGANISFLRNELLEFPNIENFPAFDNTLKVGSSLNGGYRYLSLGVNPETGIYDFVDVNGDGNITSLRDRGKFVERQQDYFGGITNSFTYKGLQLDIFVQFVKQKGNDFLTLFPPPGARAMYNQPAEVLNRWQNPGDITNVQQYSTSNSSPFYRYTSSDAAIVDASYIRLKNISLSWQIPAKWLAQSGIKNVKLYVNAQNLLTFTNYKGVDPESQGIRLPPLRVITSGIQVTLK